MKTLALAIILSVLATPLAAQWLKHPTPGIPRTPDGKPNLTAPAPRTPDGKVDLSGVWQRISPKYARNIAADLKPGEVQPSAEALVQRRLEDFGKDHMSVQSQSASETAGRAGGTDTKSVAAEWITACPD